MHAYREKKLFYFLYAGGCVGGRHAKKDLGYTMDGQGMVVLGHKCTR